MQQALCSPFSPSYVALEARLWRDEKVRMRGGGKRRRFSELPPLTLALSPQERGEGIALQQAGSGLEGLAMAAPAVAPRLMW
jgi:hypothetical protein